MPNETSAQRRWWVTWLAIPAGIALATLLIGALWLSRERSVVTEPMAAEKPATPVATPVPQDHDEHLAPPPPVEDVGALAQLGGRPASPAVPSPAARAALVPTDPPRDARDRAVPTPESPEPRAENTHASVRDSSGDRAPLPVPSTMPRAVERPSIVPRPSPSPSIVEPAGSPDAAIARIQRCPTMQACIQAIAAPLAAYGNTTTFTDPGVATVSSFEETRSAYRRALNEVRTAAKGLVDRPGGDRHEEALRSMFQALPQPAEFELSEHEIPVLRRAMEKVVARWLAERRATITTTLGMRIQLLTPAGDRPFEITFEHPPSTIGGLTDLKSFMREELAGTSELKGFRRQRHATVKLVLNPGGTFGVD